MTSSFPDSDPVGSLMAVQNLQFFSISVYFVCILSLTTAKFIRT